MNKINKTTKVISLRAKDRILGTPGSFTVKINRLMRVVKLKIQNFMMPLSYYNINNTNNTISFNDGVARVATLTSGVYNITQLIQNLKIVMDGVSTLVFTITYNSILQKVNISSTSNFSINFTSLSSDLPILLGFNRANYTGASSYLSDNVININRIYSQVNLFSNSLSVHNQQVYSSNPQDGNLICRINNSIYKPGEYLYYSNDDNSQNELMNNNSSGLEHIDIQILDVDNKIIDFNGVDDGIVLNLIATYIH